ncbi:MAG: alpha/beta hydrolase [Ktedonobacterales bacterium]|nr:alpha/beta hydrolase [Ktedonobacterales bacterium]
MPMPLNLPRTLARAAGITTASLAGAALAVAGLNRLISQTAPAPEAPMGLTPERYAWAGGDCVYSVGGKGQAVVLLHGIYAGASSFEFRHIFPLLLRNFRVFAPDLPGCGQSAHPPRVYDPETYIDFILDFVQQVVGGADAPVHVIASSLTGAYVIKAAERRPDLFERLILIEPTGIDHLAVAPSAWQRFLGKLFRAPLVGTALYHGLVSRPGLRYYLKRQVYHDPTDVTDDVVDAYYAVGHVPNARYAASSFVGGSLNCDIADEFEMLTQPVLLCWGRHATFTPLEDAESFMERNVNTELAIFDHSASLPQEEEADDFVTQVRNWLRAGIGSRY